jgi:hydroxymethylglutaryl-CoA lyase
MKVEIVEVGPRDGLQNESRRLSLADREWLVRRLAAANIRRIEVGAFVSEKWVPQMAGSGELYRRLSRRAPTQRIEFSALVPNERGMINALEAKVKVVAVFGACSETFSERNINCSIKESFKRFKDVIALAKPKKVKVRGYLSTVFGCPYEGAVSIKKGIQLATRLLELGVFEVSIGDTIGVASPKQVRRFIEIAKSEGIFSRLAFHFHDTRGLALANVLACLDRGAEVFDSSIGGLGGCPYAKGASGNLATEDLVYMLNEMGIKTGVDLDALLRLRTPLERLIGRSLPGRLMRAGVARPLLS